VKLKILETQFLRVSVTQPLRKKNSKGVPEVISGTPFSKHQNKI
jgi:hypothetical protein